MSNDSTTGGPLAPDPSPAPAPLEGRALLTFIQAWVATLSGLDGSLVRPRWQAEPPNIPDAGVAWAAVGVHDRRSDAFPVVLHHPDVDGYDTLQRHQYLDVLCSFYDLGVDGLADLHADQLSDGAAIAQNREVLMLNGFALVEAPPQGRSVPSLIKARWLYRVDVPVSLRRVVLRNYPVRNVLSLDGTIYTSDGTSQPLKTP